MIKKLHNALLADGHMLFIHDDSGDITFSSNEMDILSVDLNNININVDVNFEDDDSETIIYVRLMAWCNRLKQHKAFKKDIRNEIMHVAWHPKTWWDWCLIEDKKKEIEPILLMRSSIKLWNKQLTIYETIKASVKIGERLIWVKKCPQHGDFSTINKNVIAHKH